MRLSTAGHKRAELQDRAVLDNSYPQHPVWTACPKKSSHFFEGKQHLFRQLLRGRSLSDEAQKVMIFTLKSECGHQHKTMKAVLSTAVHNRAEHN